MRNLFVSTMLIFLLIDCVQGQIMSGSIKYKQTNYIEIPENVPPQYVKNMPKSIDLYMKLTFDGVHSLYEKDDEYREEINPNDHMPRMFRRMRESAPTVFYKDIKGQKVQELINFFGKDFLIEDALTNYKWKISAGEQKDILGYTCMKAYYKDSTENLVVFFTPQMPVPVGPDKFGGLPGVILEVQSAQTHMMATEVIPGSVQVKAPSKGQKKTRAEFDKLKQEKMQERSEMWGRRM